MTCTTSSIYTSLLGRSHSSVTSDNFVHLKLSTQELQYGTRLGFDTWADTSCTRKHAFLESFIEGRVVSAGGFSPSLGKLDNIPIANVLYACDLADGTTIIIENCHAIYLGESMDDSLVNPIQAEDSDVRVDTQPQRFYPNEDCQNIVFPDGTKIPLEFDGVLPYIQIRRPTNEEIQYCRRADQMLGLRLERWSSSYCH